MEHLAANESVVREESRVAPEWGYGLRRQDSAFPTRRAFTLSLAFPPCSQSGVLPPQSKNHWSRFRGTTVVLVVLVGLFLWMTESPGSAAEEFLGRTYTNKAGATLPYRLLVPSKYDAKRSYSVLMFLHGAAGRGDDNLKPLDWGPRLIAEELKRGKHEFFLVVPQCPRSETWSNIRPGDQSLLGTSLLLALDLITNSLANEFNLDATRRYLTGVSMGGHATWALLCRDTGLFAAAVPVCAGGDASRVTDRIAKVPVWVFHSDDDHIVPVSHARNFVKAWRAHGGEPHYTEYTGLKHSSWKKAYTETEMYDWLFNQRRN